MYKLARLLELNNKETTDYIGAPNDDMVKDVGRGLIRSVMCDNFDAGEGVMTKLRSKEGMFSSRCALSEIFISQVDGIEGIILLRKGLVALTFRKCKAVGTVPQFFLEWCPRLTTLDLSGNQLSGEQ